jgi:ankyrin repeat protein
MPLLHWCAVGEDEKFLMKCLEAIGLPGRRDLDVLAPYGDDPDRSAAFDMAVLAGNIDIAKMLVAAGAQPPTEDTARAGCLLSALISSGRWTSARSIQYLLESGWGRFILEQDSQLTALHVAASQAPCRLAGKLLDPLTSEKNFALILTAFSRPDQVNACTSESAEYPAGTTPLHIAANEGFYYATRKLLESGARTDSLDSHGNTPFESLVRQLYYFEEMDREVRPIGSDFMTELSDTARLLHGVVSGSGISTLEKRNEEEEVGNLRFSRLGFGCEG